MATKEPWNNEIYEAMKENPADLNRKSRTKNEIENKRPLTTRFLTFLVVLMFIIVGCAIVFILWNSASQSKPISAFNNGSSAKSSAQTSQTHSSASQASSASSASSSETSSSASSSSSSEQTSSSSTSTSSSSAAAGSTYTIVSGDTPSAIASKTGVSWSTIASLNNISASGYNADGSAIYAGQVLKLK